MKNHMKKQAGDRAISIMEKGTAFLSAIFMLMMVCLIAVDVTGRYLFNSPLRGSYEIVENYLMIFMVYLGLAYAYRRGAHIRFTTLAARLSGNAKTGVNLVAQILSLLYIILLFISATRTNLINKFTETLDISKNLTLPLWPSYAVISGGLLLMALLIFFDCWKVRKGESGLLREEDDL
jgi:TRAP-type transport system small permease protein